MSILGVVLGIVGVVVLGLSVYVLRKLFDRRRGTQFPIEETVRAWTRMGDWRTTRTWKVGPW